MEYIITVGAKFVSLASSDLLASEYPDATIYENERQAVRLAETLAERAIVAVRVISSYGMEDQKTVYEHLPNLQPKPMKLPYEMRVGRIKADTGACNWDTIEIATKKGAMKTINLLKKQADCFYLSLTFPHDSCESLIWERERVRNEYGIWQGAGTWIKTDFSS